MLYLTETMPGLGVAFKKSIILNEWIPIWPKNTVDFDWDYLVRNHNIRKNRECIIPDISRTYHFGEKGNTVNYFMQEKHFSNRPIAKFHNTVFNISWIINDSYEIVIKQLVQ